MGGKHRDLSRAASSETAAWIPYPFEHGEQEFKIFKTQCTYQQSSPYPSLHIIENMIFPSQTKPIH